jgi:DtxR family Mn-dependent transcriptional regulator
MAVMYTKKVEDYLEVIYILVKRKGYARTTDIADHLEIKPSSVTEMLRRLDDKGFVKYRKYEGAVLTETGYKIGEAVKGRHDSLFNLLKFLQIPAEIADADACTMEHGLHPITIVQIKKFVSFVSAGPKGKTDWIKHFKIYSETGEFLVDSDE